MAKYMYEGPVEQFGKCIEQKWKGYTTAPSEKKARSNLEYQYKIKTGRVAASQIKLPGKITEV